ncbi:hypothetical protein PV327_000247 [Microctonus hyperodae]|uniref:DDB1- and CUL4-associated factor 5 n=1 Tax=Microctonus hyperodae TaxID=165561 RepID=A0AA39G687_MICHY|nr:hypothetical protein PV327_000247 [Microctonus hyperodae]
MARLSSCNPIECILSRQIDNRFDYCERIVKSRLENCESLYRKDLFSHYGCVNAIEFSKQGDLIISGGDDRRVLLWKVEEALRDAGNPISMKAQHNSNIFCLGSDSSNAKIFSAGNDERVIVHDLKTGDPLEFFLHEKAVCGLSVHPVIDHIFSTACDDGRILIFDIRCQNNSDALCLAQYKSPFRSVMYNPVDPKQLATANAEEGVSMWDVRKPLEPLLKYGVEGSAQSCMDVRFNSVGTRLLALKRRLPPVLYDVNSPNLICQFDQPGYYNSCTMKSCCFAGDDESYVLSGSDDFGLYMWKIRDSNTEWVDSAHMILRGHRSIVNHVRYNPKYCILASSGVEKIIKIWSPFTLGVRCLGGLTSTDGILERQRKVYTTDQYTRLMIRSHDFNSHDYSHQSTREDPRMMAFFDSLVQREIEGWSSENASSTYQTPSDIEDVPSAPPEHSATDSDDSTAKDIQLMRSVLGTKINTRRKSRGGRAPERPFQSPNRITRLIRSCREKLMTLASMESGTNHAVSTNIPSDSDSDKRKSSTTDDEQLLTRCKSKLKLRIKMTKRKHSVINSTKIRRKCSGVRMSRNSKRDSHTRNQSNESDNEIPIIDVAQPSTSSGVSSRTSRYSVRTIGTDSDLGESNYSGDSSDDDNIIAKRQKLKIEGNSTRNYRRRSERYKESKNKIDREKKTNNNENQNTNDSIIDNDNNFIEQSTSTPLKRATHTPQTPDSGVTSSASPVDRCDVTANTSCTGAESSDHERTVKKSVKCFKKKIDAARKGYRKRSAS